MLTMEESSVVMKVAVPERASTTHLLARSARSTGVGAVTSACAWREAACGQSEDDATRAIRADRGGHDSVPQLPAPVSPTDVAAPGLPVRRPCFPSSVLSVAGDVCCSFPGLVQFKLRHSAARQARSSCGYRASSGVVRAVTSRHVVGATHHPCRVRCERHDVGRHVLLDSATPALRARFLCWTFRSLYEPPCQTITSWSRLPEGERADAARSR